MPLREFTDGAGRQWQAWTTVPASPREAEIFAASARLLAERARGEPADAGEAGGSARVSPAMAQGWLTFQAGDDKRRLSPVPAGWATATDAELADYLSHAVPVRLSAAAARLLGRAGADER